MVSSCTVLRAANGAPPDRRAACLPAEFAGLALGVDSPVHSGSPASAPFLTYVGGHCGRMNWTPPQPRRSDHSVRRRPRSVHDGSAFGLVDRCPLNFPRTSHSGGRVNGCGSDFGTRTSGERVPGCPARCVRAFRKRRCIVSELMEVILGGGTGKRAHQIPLECLKSWEVVNWMPAPHSETEHPTGTLSEMNPNSRGRN